jgi:molybdopterin converting factor small subunit
MLARVKLFGPMRQALGRAELEVATHENSCTCASLRGCILAGEPRLAELLHGCRFAVNGKFAAEDCALSEADEVALIGFVSGG